MPIMWASWKRWKTAEFTPLRATPPIAAASGATRWGIIRSSAMGFQTIKNRIPSRWVVSCTYSQVPIKGQTVRHIGINRTALIILFYNSRISCIHIFELKVYQIPSFFLSNKCHWGINSHWPFWTLYPSWASVIFNMKVLKHH